MQTALSAKFHRDPDAKLAAGILRKCVHCGFCNATCPTYELLGNELDGPRGRIYQIKQLFEGAPPNADMQLHLDRCLTCLACETTCPSGVKYGALLEIARETMARELPRPFWQRGVLAVLRRALVMRGLVKALVRTAQMLRAVLPRRLALMLPRASSMPGVQTRAHARKMLALEGCVQSSLTPDTNRAAARVLDELGVGLVELAAGCCGALALHASGEARARAQARAVIDLCLPLLQSGEYESLVMTASGCGVTVKNYAHLLRHDRDYADKARALGARTFDLAEIIAREAKPVAPHARQWHKVAFHAPCTLQHGQRIKDCIEGILTRAGYELCAVADAHLCCGSAGAYSLLQPKISRRLRENKLRALNADAPEVICTANVGCQAHLRGGTPVVHWIELLV